MSARVPPKMVSAALAATDFADIATSRAWMRRALGAALTAAGYRILAPGDLDPVTIERCAAVCDEIALGGVCATAIRSLQENKNG